MRQLSQPRRAPPVAGWRKGLIRGGRRQLVPAGTRPVLAPTLEGWYYTDPAVLAAECERIFEGQWYYVGRADEIAAPGRFIRRQVGRETVLGRPCCPGCPACCPPMTGCSTAWCCAPTASVVDQRPRDRAQVRAGRRRPDAGGVRVAGPGEHAGRRPLPRQR